VPHKTHKRSSPLERYYKETLPAYLQSAVSESDKHKLKDPQKAAEYLWEVQNFMRQSERLNAPEFGYM